MELREVTAGYGGTDVVKGISLRFQPGEVTVLAGPNGCGKSTLLRAAARLLPLRGGQVLVDGADTAGWSSRAFARQTALLPQSRPVPRAGGAAGQPPGARWTCRSRWAPPAR